MGIIDNITKTLQEDLSGEIKQGSKLAIVAACFSFFAFEKLKKELKNIDELRFIFTSPTFITDQTPKAQREFYIPRLNRERSLYGTEFEIKLRNELTQKAIAKECADWIRQKVTFKSNITNENMTGFMHVDDNAYMPINGFTTIDLGCERGNNAYNIVQKISSPDSNKFLSLFNQLWQDKNKLQDVTNVVIDNIASAYNENSPEFIYFVILYNIFNEFLEDISEDVLPNEATGFKSSKIWNMLFNFQKDAALAIINKLEKHNGCILADSVGLGKTFTALSVIKYYENRNKSVLVLCPKKLNNNWNTYKANYINNPIAEDRLRYDVLFHTDLNRLTGKSNGIDLNRIHWNNYDLVVIDESHNFRNGGRLSGKDNEKENRYLKLLNQVIRKGVKTKVLMLSATPVNNRFNDLKNQLALAYEGKTSHIDENLHTHRSLDEIFKNAQKAFNIWSKQDTAERTTENLQRMLDFDFFQVLDSVTIARSRKHIQKYYDTTDIGTFPTRLKPISVRPKLTDLANAISYKEIFEQLMLLNLSIYTPTHFILPSKMEKYAEIYEDNTINVGFTQANREQGIRRLMAINLMKRLESSVFSFNHTLERIKNFIQQTIATIESHHQSIKKEIDLPDITNFNDLDEDEQNNELFTFGKKVKIALADMDYLSWKHYLTKDYEILSLLTHMVSDITAEYDLKLQNLLATIKNKQLNPINNNNKKVIIFTAFADTASYLFDHVSQYVQNNFSLHTAMITGSVDGRSTVPKLHCDLNTVLTCFSPKSKDKHLLMPNNTHEIDILIATDCISEGQNLQDCDYLINYDIHWNPVRIIQRFGRIPRTEQQNNRYKNPDNDKRGVWKAVDLSVARITEKDIYEIITPSGRSIFPPEGRSWGVSKNKLEELIRDNRIWYGESGNNVPSVKKFLSEVKSGITCSTIWEYSEVGHTDKAKKDLKNLFDNQSFFDYPKPIELIKQIAMLATNSESIILDFFSGSATTAHAVMQLNAEDGGNRKFIMVQLPETTDEKSEAYKAGYKNICEIGKERIRRAGNKIAQENPQAKFDKGFRVLKCDSSNMKEIYYNPAEYNTDLLDVLIDNIKADRTAEDLLFQVMLDLGVLLSSDIKQTTIAGKTVFNVADNFLMACFDTDINEEVITAIAKQKPYYFVMRDSSMENDSVATNFEQIFTTYSPETKRKVL